MNKTIMFLGMLAVSFANAQQGNVGVNTDAPKATLEIQPTAANLAGTTNEGIIAPKLTKERIASIAVPVEGTLVYATDAEYTGNNVKVAKIDEKGYYYFDGTEWVKTSNEWVYDATTNRINLKRSGDATGTFKNKIFYNADTGQYVDIDDENNIRTIGLTTDRNKNTSYKEDVKALSEDIKFKNYIHSESKNLHASISRSADGRETTYKQLGQQSIVATEGDDTQRIYTNSSRVAVPPKNSNDFAAIYGDASGSYLFGTGNVTASYGQSGQITIGNTQNVKSYITGLIGTSAVATSGTIRDVYGINGRIFYYSPVGAQVDKSIAGYFSVTTPANDNTLVKKHMGIQSYMSILSKNTGQGEYIAGIHSDVTQGSKIQYTNFYGIYSKTRIANTGTPPNKHYGIYIENVEGGKESNYAIYTNKGKIHLGDEVEVKGSIKVASTTTNDNCTQDKAGTIRFKDNKFQGCTGTNWKDLHN